jgi:hypothetical protein
MKVSNSHSRDITGIQGIKIQDKGIFYYKLSNNRQGSSLLSYVFGLLLDGSSPTT